MTKTVSLAVLCVPAAAWLFTACAQGSTGYEGDTSGAGGDSSDVASGPGPSGPGPSGAGTSGSGTSGAGATGAGTSGAGTSGAGASGSGSGGQGGASGCGPCDVNAMCDTSSGMCVCNQGYTGDGITCSDIDECAMVPNPCGMGATCTNEPGSYTCMCQPGYQDQGGVCVDIDECAMGNGGCATGCTCMNVMGGPPTCDCILTQSSSQTITPGNSVACVDNITNEHTDNSYYRVFDLGALGIDGAFSVSQIEMGIEQASSNSGTQPAQVKLHQLNGNFTVGNLTPITTTSVNVPDAQLTVLPFFVNGTAAASSRLVVEFFTPSASGNSLFVGSNNLSETAPSYLRALDCSLNQPTTTAGIGYPNMHIVMRVHGTYTKP